MTTTQTLKLYDHPNSMPSAPSLVVELDGQRFMVREQRAATGGKTPWDMRLPYAGSVRLDGIATCLRGMAWAMGVPGAMDAECPQS